LALHPFGSTFSGTDEREQQNVASIKTAIAIASGMLVLGAGLGVAGVAVADITPTPYPTSTPTSPTPSDPPPGTERPDWPTSPDQGAQEAALIKMLAEMLGVDEAQIKAALDEVRAAYEAEGPAALDAYLDQAVQLGILTQEEADAVRQAVEGSMTDLAPR
jgi:hypothetical protein